MDEPEKKKQMSDAELRKEILELFEDGDLGSEGTMEYLLEVDLYAIHRVMNKLIEEGLAKCHLAFKRRDDREREAAFDEMVALSQELGLGYE